MAGSRVPRELFEFLQKHGSHTLSYSLFQPGLSHFQTPDGVIAHETKLWKRLVLGDPLSDDEQTGEVIDAFLERYPDPFFCAVGRHTAEHLAARGFLVNEFGRDIRIPLQTYTLEGQKKTKLRQAWNKFLNSQYTIDEFSDGDPGAEAAAIEISRVWRSTKIVSTGEVRFLTRPIVQSAEKDVRKFLVRDEKGRPVALYYFDPLYTDGKVIGYSTAFKRRLPEAMTGLEEAVTVWATQKFRDEGKTWLHLGMLPLYKVDGTPEFKHSVSLYHDLINASRYGDGIIYNFSGHADFKHRFRGEEFPIYLATRHRFNAHGMMAMQSASGVKQSIRSTLNLTVRLCAALLTKKKKT